MMEKPLNTTKKFELAGKTYDVPKLGMMQVMEITEKGFLKLKAYQARLVADEMGMTDKTERLNWAKSCLADLPSGLDLERAAMEWLQSLKGTMAVVKDAIGVSDEEAKIIMDKEGFMKLKELADHICDMGSEEESEFTDAVESEQENAQ